MKILVTFALVVATLQLAACKDDAPARKAPPPPQSAMTRAAAAPPPQLTTQHASGQSAAANVSPPCDDELPFVCEYLRLVTEFAATVANTRDCEGLVKSIRDYSDANGDHVREIVKQVSALSTDARYAYEGRHDPELSAAAALMAPQLTACEGNPLLLPEIKRLGILPKDN